MKFNREKFLNIKKHDFYTGITYSVKVMTKNGGIYVHHGVTNIEYVMAGMLLHMNYIDGHGSVYNADDIERLEYEEEK